MAGTRGQAGRPATTTHGEIADTAVKLFFHQGYAETSVADIAGAVGIARRTFFSYFASKADAFWWRDEENLIRIERTLAETPTDATHPLQQIIDIALTAAHQEFGRDFIRRRITLIESNPDLQIGAARFQNRWRAVIANHLRSRIAATKSDLLPEVIAAALLAIANTVLTRWAASDSDDNVIDIFVENLAILRSAFEETVSDQVLP